MASTLGVVPAGGLGARLGGTIPKPLRMVAGESLLGRAIRTLAALCDEVVVTAPRERADALAPVLAGARFVADPPNAAGPLAGLVAGLSAARFDRALVLGVDFPLARTAALAQLLAWLGEARGAPSPGLAVVPAPGGIPQPLVAAYAPESLPHLAASLASGERSLVTAVRALPPRLVGDSALAALPGGLENFANLNRPDDLVAIERRLAGETAHGGAR